MVLNKNEQNQSRITRFVITVCSGTNNWFVDIIVDIMHYIWQYDVYALYLQYSAYTSYIDNIIIKVLIYNDKRQVPLLCRR